MTDHQTPKFIKHDGWFYNLAFLRRARVWAPEHVPAGQTKFQLAFFDGDSEQVLDVHWPLDSCEGAALLQFLEGNTIFGVDLNSKAPSTIRIMSGKDGAS